MPLAVKNPMFETQLFKSVAPFIKSIAPEVLAYEFLKAFVASPIDFNKDEGNVNDGFIWEKTPQGEAFWTVIDLGHRKNKNDPEYDEVNIDKFI